MCTYLTSLLSYFVVPGRYLAPTYPTCCAFPHPTIRIPTSSSLRTRITFRDFIGTFGCFCVDVPDGMRFERNKYRDLDE